MKKNIIKKPITLLGPSGIGKSLIAKTLSNETNLPVVCVDDIIQFIDLEQSGRLSKKTSKQKEYALNTLREIKYDENLSKNLETKEGQQKTIELLNKILRDYNMTIQTIGPLNRYYQILDENDKLFNNCSKPIEFIITLNLFTVNLLKEITKHTSTPFILDPPASFGWHIEDELIDSQSMYTKEQIKQIERETSTFLASSYGVLLEPGSDYDLRNPCKQIAANNLLLQNFAAYYDNDLSLIVSTNNFFSEPDNEYLQHRSWLDAGEHIIKDNLRNNDVINNLSLQIITGIKELEQENSY